MLDRSYGNNANLAYARAARKRFNKLKQTKDFAAWRVRQYGDQQGKCAWCVQPISRSGHKVHVDHALPLIQGGSNRYSNLVLSHARCNIKKWIRIDAAPQWILNNQAKRERQQMLDQQQAIYDGLLADAWQERLAYWLKTWV
jgi:5-methylcytosine-specific restriction endonuclease McrA